jgi:hypothetical protein
MAEPTTTTAALAIVTGATLATLVPGLDGNAVVGAFAGAALVALHARDVSTVSRIIYFMISWLMGYMCAGEIVRDTPIHETGVAAFAGAALVIAVTLSLIERIKTADLTQLTHWFRRGGP